MAEVATSPKTLVPIDENLLLPSSINAMADPSILDEKEDWL
jgi:hypothetical protein